MGSWGPEASVFFSASHVWFPEGFWDGSGNAMGHPGLSEVNILGMKLDRKIIEFERKSAAKSIGVFNPQIVGRFQPENLQDGETWDLVLNMVVSHGFMSFSLFAAYWNPIMQGKLRAILRSTQEISRNMNVGTHGNGDFLEAPGPNFGMLGR